MLARTGLAALGGCASGPYYYGGTSYRMHNIGGLPVSGSLGVHVTHIKARIVEETRAA